MTWPVRRSANRRGGLVGAIIAIAVAILSAVAVAYLAPRPAIEPPPQSPQQQSNPMTRTDRTVAEPAAAILETGSTANEARPDATLDTGVWVEPVRRVKPITPPESENNPAPAPERKTAP